MAPTSETARARGRPKAAEAGVSTQERLLAAAVAACVERGFEDTTLGDIARRAAVSAPAIYNHFGSKEELLVAAGQWALERLRVDDSARLSAAEVVRAFLADDFADSRRLLAELHLAGQRHPEVAELLAKWHGDHAAEWMQRGTAPNREAAVKTFFALLLGLCHIESLPTLTAPNPAVADQAVRVTRVLFPEEEHIVTIDSDSVDFSLLSDAFQAAPAATFAALRERCPVHHTTKPAPHFSLSREADVTVALRDEATWSSKYGPGLVHTASGGVLVSTDPPLHTTERLAISRAFRPSVIDAMEPEMRVLITEVVDAFVDRGQGDLIKDLAMPLPLTVMCWLLGTPRHDIAMFRSWVMPMAEAVALEGGREANDHVITAYREFGTYFGEHIARRARAVSAGEEVPDDLLTRLLTVEREGERLSDQQVIGFCQFLLVAGSATTTLLIGNVVNRLMELPDQMALVRADRTLIPNALEESLRFDAPVHGLFRTNNCPVTLHGVEIPVDSKVYMMFGSANRDPAAWDDPDRFDVTRDLTDLRKRHAAFGVGIHYCLGAPLSRLEGALALEAVLDRMPRIRPDGPPTIVQASVLNGFESLPVRWD